MSAVIRGGVLALLGLALVAVLAVGLVSSLATDYLGRPTLYSGYSLLAVMVFLALFNARKRLPVVAKVRVYYWLVAHVVLGLVALALFALHVDEVWPNGVYEQFLAGLFYLVSASGVLGYLGQRFLASRLADLEDEFIYERIPAELAVIRASVEDEVLKATEATGSDTLSRHYSESLAWFFRRPRFFVDHLLGRRRAQWWLEDQLKAVSRYLNEAEAEHLEVIAQLGNRKIAADAHYATQSVLKSWLFVHLPLALSLMLLAFWHVLVVNVYLF